MLKDFKCGSKKRSLTNLESSNGTLYVESISPRGWTLHVESCFHGPMGIRAM